MNATPSEAIEEDFDTWFQDFLTSNEATLSDPQPAANAAREDDDAINIVAQVREEPQCEIAVVEFERSHNTAAHGVQQRQSAEVQPVLLK